MYNRIGFIGLGLIGGSIAKAIRRYHPDIKLFGHARSISTIEQAHREGVIENSQFLPLEEFADMDILFLCAPVRLNIDYLTRLAPLLLSTTLVTDIGSVKGNIHKAADELGIAGQFIGGHPMAGSEKDGFSNSSDLLIENAYYLLTRSLLISESIFNDFSSFIASLGAVPLETTPDKHDHATAAISHLPHIISAALVGLVRDNDTPDGLMRTIAAGGFKDITRISSSSPVMWQNICIDNQDEILKLIDMYLSALDTARDTVASSDESGILDFFSRARDYRDSLNIPRPGIIPHSYDFYLDLADESGQIAIVATILAAAKISIKNIGIIHNREFQEGVLQIVLYDEESMQISMQLLTEHGYHIHIRN